MTEQELLVDCLQRLNRLAVNYFLTGSMASNYWGIPRTTHDLDFVVQFPPSEVPRVVAAFEGEYFIQESSVRSAFRPPYQFEDVRAFSVPRAPESFFLPPHGGRVRGAR